MDRQEILLKEYELCQQDIIDTSSRYWTIVNIFMAASTVVLGAIVAGVISGNFISKTYERTATLQIFVASLVVIVLGAGIIAVLVSLMSWLRRVGCLAAIAYGRMREIELELGMWKNWRVHGIDNWNASCQISAGDRARLIQYHSAEWWQKKGYLKEYAPPNTKSNRCILWALIAMWTAIVLLALSIVLSIYYWWITTLWIGLMLH